MPLRFFFLANRIVNIYKASIMRSVTEIKKNTAIKELHIALVPKWHSTSATLDSDPEDSVTKQTDSDSKSCEKDTKADSNGDTTTISNSKDSRLLDCDNVSNDVNHSGAANSSHLRDNTINLGDKDTDKSSHNSDISETQKEVTVKPVWKPPVVPKIKYFFERGDSLKKEMEEKNYENQSTESTEIMEQSVTDIDNKIKGLKREHEPEVRFS